MKICYLSVAVCLLTASQFTFAVELDPVIVTATRTAQTADDTLASVTVVTREDIERQQAQSVQDVLRSMAGVTITNNGGAGKTTSVFIRGTESDHVLVLIDGIKMGSATSGTTAFQDIPIEQIERIEVVRGPRSSLYGSEAIGGVIQIFTRKGGATLQPYFNIGVGSYRSYNASVGVTGGGERGWFNLSASGIDTEGFNACNGKPSPGGAGCFTIEPDKDGYNNLSGNLRAGYRFENGFEVDTHVLRVIGENNYDGGFVNEAETVQQIIGGKVLFSPVDIWQISLAVGKSQDESDNFKDAALMSRFDTERDTVSLQNDVSVADTQLLTLGFDYQDDKIDTIDVFSETSRDNKGVFIQHQGEFSSHDVLLSLRQDDNEQFGEHNTGGLGWGYALGKNLRLTANYGTAFKAPSFNELYFPFFGNPDLRPEESNSVEFGLSGKGIGGRWSVNVYETRIDDLIAYDASIFAPGNINEARIRGIEAILITRFMDWNLSANLTLLDPENRSNDSNRGNVLTRRAEHSLRVNADKKFGKYAMGASIGAEGKRYDDLANIRELDGYATVDLRAEYILTRVWRLQTRIENLFDKDYETASFYNQAGRSVYVSLRYQP